MRHDMKSIRAELARISDDLARVEGQLADLLGVDDPYGRAVAARDAATKRVDLVRAERVSRYLEQLAGTPIAYSRLVDSIGGNKDATRRALQWLEDEGYVTVTPGRRNSRMYTTRRPFRAPRHDPFNTTNA